MILYHGSNKEIDRIDLSKSRPYKDFGWGFYTTPYKEQALAMAQRTVRLFKSGIPAVTVFFLDDGVLNDPSLRIRKFDRPNTEWVNFVVNNRNMRPQDTNNPECNIDNKYDIVIGPAVDDDIVLQLRLFLRGLISIPDLKKTLKYKELTSQISFHTEAAVCFLTKAEVTHG
ncbi:MAG: DUF3990 domain-containing protein [Spirochaetaceae bacterium]|jgi:hypothetical protein|nr:DUF3990 domain-containing protein [Spirochaetaceae bacterium]